MRPTILTFNLNETRLSKLRFLCMKLGLLVKPVPAALERLETAARELPYAGAKEMLLVEEVEDREFLRDLLEAMEPELPEKQKK